METEIERVLPTVVFKETTFVVDVANNEFRQKDDPENTISFEMLIKNGNEYVLIYDPLVQNVPGSNRFNSPDIINVTVPPLGQLDIEGMALKYGKNVDEIKGKTDFEIMVDQQALEKRLNGSLPTIEIQDHIFFVDLRMDMLRPKDDFLSKGIVFKDIEFSYFPEDKAYIITYSPIKREHQEIDLFRLTSIPKDIVSISFPHERFLDPIGYNLKHGSDELHGLEFRDLKSHFVAKTIDWEDTNLPRIIERNKAKIEGLEQKSKARRNKRGL